MCIVTKESNPELYNALFPEDEIKEINIPENVLVALGDLTNGALNYYKAIEAVKVRHNIILDCITNLQEKYERLKNLEYKFFDNSGDEESFTLEDYLELGNKLYDLQEENERLSVELNKNMIERNNYLSRNEKAVEYLANCDWNNKDFENLYDILGGDE